MKARLKKQQHNNDVAPLVAAKLLPAARSMDTPFSNPETAQSISQEEQGKDKGFNFGEVPIFAAGSGLAAPPLQPKFTVSFTRNQSQGKLEPVQREEGQEEELMQGKLEPVQREEGEEEEPAQAKGELGSKVKAIQAKINLAPSGGGKSMPEPVQQKMENAFGTDFSGVRIHEGPQAKAINAIAYTQGSDIHFQPGKYQPDTQSGQELLGHELTHVVQQRAGQVAAPQSKGIPLNADPNLEAEADRLGAKASRGEAVEVMGSPSGIQRKSLTEEGAIQRFEEDDETGGEKEQSLITKDDFHKETKSYYVTFRDNFLEDIDRLLEIFSDLNNQFKKENLPSEKIALSEFIIEVLYDLDKCLVIGIENTKNDGAINKVLVDLRADGETKRKQKEETKKRLEEGIKNGADVELNEEDEQRESEHQGSAKSLFTKLAGKIGAAVPSPGDAKEFNIGVKFPVGPSLFVGGEFSAKAKHLKNNQYHVRCEMLMTFSSEWAIADLNAGFGGYIEAQAESPEQVIQLISYAFYRRLVESQYIPVEVSNYLWGGTTKDIGYKLAERWAGKVEKENFGGKKDSYVETGALAEASASVGVGSVKASAGVRGSIGSRIDKQSVQTNKLIAEFGLDREKAIPVVQVLNESGPDMAIKKYEEVTSGTFTTEGDKERILEEIKTKKQDAFLGVSHTYTGRGNTQRNVAKGVAEAQLWLEAKVGGLSGGFNCTGKWMTDNSGEKYTFQELSVIASVSGKLPSNGITQFISDLINLVSKAANTAKSQEKAGDKNLQPDTGSAVTLEGDGEALNTQLNQKTSPKAGTQLEASYSLLYHPAKDSKSQGSSSHEIMVTYNNEGALTILFSATKQPGSQWEFKSFGVDLANLSASGQLFKEFLELKKELNILRDPKLTTKNPHRESEIIEQITAILKEKEVQALLTSLNSTENSEEADGKADENQGKFIEELKSLVGNEKPNLDTLTNYLSGQKAGLEEQIKQNLHNQLDKGVKNFGIAEKVSQINLPEIGSLKGMFSTLNKVMQIKLPSIPQATGETPQKFILKAAKIPLGDLGDIPVELNATAHYTPDKQYKLRCNLAIVGGPKFLSNLQGELGGYAEAQAATSEQANDLISYAFYRRLVESKYIPVQISNYLWGGTTMSAGYARAEQWAGQVEKDAFATNDQKPNAKKAYVETGVYAAANLKSGKQQVTGEIRTGSRYDSESVQVNKLIGDFGVDAAKAKEFVAKLTASNKARGDVLVKDMNISALNLDPEKEKKLTEEIKLNGANVFLGMTHTYKGLGDAQRKASRDVKNLELSADVSTEYVVGKLKGLANWQKDVTGKDNKGKADTFHLHHIAFEGSVAGKMKFDLSNIQKSVQSLIDKTAELGKQESPTSGKLIPGGDCDALAEVSNTLAKKIEKMWGNLERQLKESAQKIPKDLNIQLEASYKLLYHPSQNTQEPGKTSHQIMVTYAQLGTTNPQPNQPQTVADSGARQILFSATKDTGDWQLSALGFDVSSLTGKVDVSQLLTEFSGLKEELKKLRESGSNPHREAELIDQLKALLKEEALQPIIKKEQPELMKELKSLLPIADLSPETLTKYLDEEKTRLKEVIKTGLEKQIGQGVNDLKEELLSISLPGIGTLKGMFNSLDQILQLKLPQTSSEIPQKFILKAENLSLGDLGTLPIEINATAQSLPGNQYKVRCNLAVTGAPKIPGLDKLQTELGGYAEAQAANPTQASQLISYAFYRRLVESKYIPVQISNYLWGGTAMNAGYARAEQWAGEVEKDAFAVNDKNPNAKNTYVETGLYAGANARVGNQQVRGEIRSGSQLNRESIQVNKLIGEFGVDAAKAKEFVAKLNNSEVQGDELVNQMKPADLVTGENLKKLTEEIKLNGANAFLGMTHTYKGLGDTQRQISQGMTNLNLSTQVQADKIAGNLNGSASWAKDVTGEGDARLQNIKLEGSVAATIPMPQRLKEKIQTVKQKVGQVESNVLDSGVVQDARGVAAKIKDTIGKVINSASELCMGITKQPIVQKMKVARDAMNVAQQIVQDAQLCVAEIQKYEDKLNSMIQQIENDINQLENVLSQFSNDIPVKVEYKMSYIPAEDGTVGKVSHSITVTYLDNKPLLTANKTGAGWDFNVLDLN